MFDVVIGSNSAAVQKQIDEASKLDEQRPIVHFPIGSYKLDKTLQVPAGSDIQLVGDGASEIATVLEWKGKAGEPLLRLAGPTLVSIRDMHITAGGGIGIFVEKCDQLGGKVFGDQLNLAGVSPYAKATVGIWMNGVEKSDVQLRNFQGGGSTINWIKVTGGGGQRSGRDSEGQNSVFCGATGSSDSPYMVEKGGRLIVRTVYHELDPWGEVLPTALRLADSGTLNLDTTRFSYKTSPKAPLVDCEGMRGSLAMTSCLFMAVNSTYPGWIQLRGNGGPCKVLFLDCLFWCPDKPATTELIWKNETSPPANAALLECNQNGQSKEGKGFFEFFPERNAPNNDELIRTTLVPLRTARMWQPSEVKPGLTNLLLHRVMIRAGKGGMGVVLEASHE